jgi:hypothetical protein
VGALSLYCERLGPDLFAEPLNALSNLAFLGAAVLAWREHQQRGDLRALALLLASIGIGSLLFHTLATPLAQLGDVLPIALFQVSYLYLYLRRVARLTLTFSAGWLVLYVAALAAASQAPQLLNGSLGYAPAALAVMILGVLHYRLCGRLNMLGAALIFLLSLLARTVDLMLCPLWPYGTHFLWHLLNAVMLQRLLAAYRTATTA